MNKPSPVTEAIDEFLQDEHNVRGAVQVQMR